MDWQQFFYREYFGFMVWQILAAAAALWLVTTIIQMMNRIKKAGKGDIFKRVQCATCGWKGKTSKHSPVCAKCRSGNLIDI